MLVAFTEHPVKDRIRFFSDVLDRLRDVSAHRGTIAVLGSAALLATLLPAIQSATIAPVIVLQQE